MDSDDLRTWRLGRETGWRWWLRCAAAVACVLIVAPMVQAEGKFAANAELIHRVNKRFCQLIRAETMITGHQDDEFQRIKKILAGLGKRYIGEVITVEEAYPYIRCRSNSHIGVYLDLLATVVESRSSVARDINGIALIHYLSHEARDPGLLRKIVACRKDSVPAAPTGTGWDRIGVVGCKDLLESNAVYTRRQAQYRCPGRMEYIDLNLFAAHRDLEAVGFTREQAKTVTDPYSTVREFEAVGFTHKQAAALIGHSSIRDHLWRNYPTRAAFVASGFTREQAISVLKDYTTDDEYEIPPLGSDPSDSTLEFLGFTREQAEAIYFRNFTSEREFEALGFTRDQARVLVVPRKVARRLYLEDLGFTREQAVTVIEARDVGYNFAVASDLEAAGATREQAVTAVKAMRSRECLGDFWRFTKALYDRLADGPLRDQAFCQEVLNEPLHCSD